VNGGLVYLLFILGRNVVKRNGVVSAGGSQRRLPAAVKRLAPYSYGLILLPGLLPVQRLNARENALGSEKPTR